MQRITLAALTAVGLTLGLTPVAHADATGNPNYGSGQQTTAYNGGMYACRAATNFLLASSQSGTLHTYASSAVDETLNWAAYAYNSYPSSSFWINFYTDAAYVGYDFHNGANLGPRAGDTYSSTLTRFWNTCQGILPQNGGAGDYAKSVYGNGYSYRWNPCQTITWDSSGPGQNADTVMYVVHNITGLQFRKVGSGGMIHIHYGAMSGSEAGLAATGVSIPNVNYPGQGWITSADVSILGGQASTRELQVLEHEIGHAMGLAHSSASNELMYYQVSGSSPILYNEGDYVGLLYQGVVMGGC